MADDDNGAVDTVGPWTIKAVPTQTRTDVIRAAQRENLTVGQWLEQRVREWTQAGSPVAVLAVPSDALTVIERTIAAAATLAAAPDVPQALRRRANQLLRDGLAGDKRQAGPRLLAAPHQAALGTD